MSLSLSSLTQYHKQDSQTFYMVLGDLSGRKWKESGHWQANSKISIVSLSPFSTGQSRCITCPDLRWWKLGDGAWWGSPHLMAKSPCRRACGMEAIVSISGKYNCSHLWKGMLGVSRRLHWIYRSFWSA